VTVAAIRYSWRRFGDAWGMASVNLFGGLPGNWPLWLLGCAGGEDASTKRHKDMTGGGLRIPRQGETVIGCSRAQVQQLCGP
jgi:hypothetical protein